MLLADVPVVLDREQAARLAREELADPAYHGNDPTPWARAVDWLLERLEELLHSVSSGPGGWFGIVALVVLLAVLVAVVRARLGPVRASAAHPVLFEGADPGLDAAGHRAAARRAAADGAYAEAVREHLRALIRELEERDRLAVVPGRTAREAVAAAAQVLPGLAGELAAAGDRFDLIWYGAAPARLADAEEFARLDGSVLAALRVGAHP